jgi:hypothetical protein
MVPALDPPPDPLTAAFATIDKLAAKDVPDLAVLLAPDVDAMVLLLVALRRAIAQLKWADEELEAEIVKAMPGKDVEVPGVGTVTMRTGTTRTAWDKPALVAALTARIADDPAILVNVETGELLPPAQTVEAVLSRFLESVTPSFKLTGLRAAKIDPGEYCSTSYGRKTIQLPPIEAWVSGEEPTE